MKLQFGLSAYERARGDLPELPVVNMFAEEAQSEERGIALQSRPGFETSLTMATPVQALFKGDGVLDSSLYGVANGKLYHGAVLIGTLDGSGPFSMAGYEDKLFAAGGGSLWGYNGVTLAAVAFPDSADVTKIVVGGSRLIAIRADTEKFYWSDVLSDTIDALSFASAENQPDRLKDMLYVDDVAILFGKDSVEFWPNGSDPDLPFQPLEGRVFERGIRDTGCATKFGPTFAWVTDTNQVCITNSDSIVSNPGLEAITADSASVRLWTFYLEGTEFLALTLDTRTFVYSYRSRLWSEFASYGETNWLASCFAGGSFGATNGNVLTWGTGWEDVGGELERRFRAGAPLNSGTVTASHIGLRNNVGSTGFLSGDYTDPTVEMRLSRNGGRTWGNWRQASLGTQGQYRKRVQWMANGVFGSPGVLAEFRVTAPVDWRVSEVVINEAGGF